jgi:hypothetical protein
MFKQIGMMSASLVEKLLFVTKIIICDYYSPNNNYKWHILITNDNFNYKWLVAKGNFPTNALCLVH